MFIKRIRCFQSFLLAVCVTYSLVYSSSAAFAQKIKREKVSSMHQALEYVYHKNPSIRSAKIGINVAQGSVEKAKSGYMPNIYLQGSVGYNRLDRRYKVAAASDGSSTRVHGNVKPIGGGINASINLFDGGQTYFNTQQAKNSLLASRYNFVNVQSAIFYKAISTYMILRQDKAILRLDRSNKSVMEKQLLQVKNRYRVGRVTKTDVAQARSGLAGAVALVLNAQTALASDRAVFRQLVGSKPSTTLDAPSSYKHIIPPTLEEVLYRAIHNNPQIKIAQANRRAAYAGVKVARGAFLPKLDVTASYNATRNPAIGVHKQTEGVIAGTLTIPLYQSGSEYADLNQAKNLESQQRLQIVYVRRDIRQSVYSAWYAWKSSQNILTQIHVQISASKDALLGVEQEAIEGKRTTLDVLNAQQTLLDARVQLVRANTIMYLDEINLVTLMGNLTPKILGLT